MNYSRSFAIFCLVLILGLLSLGTWQLYRKEEKEILLKALAKAYETPPQDADEVKTPSLFQPLFIKGRFLPNKTIFLSAKTHQGKSGVYVLDVFQTQGKKFLLVQRGWAQTPTASPPLQTLTLEGIARLPSPPTYFQPKNTPPTYFWIDLKALSDELNLSLLPYYIVSKTSYDTHVLPTDPIPFPSNNHLQYAITWYILAFFLLCVLFYRKKYFLQKEHT